MRTPQLLTTSLRIGAPPHETSISSPSSNQLTQLCLSLLHESTLYAMIATPCCNLKGLINRISFVARRKWLAVMTDSQVRKEGKWQHRRNPRLLQAANRDRQGPRTDPRAVLTGDENNCRFSSGLCSVNMRIKFVELSTEFDVRLSQSPAAKRSVERGASI